MTSFAEGIGQFYHTADGKPAKLRHIILQSLDPRRRQPRLGALGVDGNGQPRPQ